LTQDVLLAPLEAGVIPLPHQLHALTRAVTGDRVRYLLADEVGLGKTIEAGLIFRELKLRGLVKRVLVVAPKGLVTQWVQEMQTHFGEEFRLLTPSEFSSWRNLTGADNVWRQFDQVVCPVDSIKPVERRRGWSREKLEAYNQERLGDLIDAGWDLIVCDEAHRLGGSTEQVARYRLGKHWPKLPHTCCSSRPHRIRARPQASSDSCRCSTETNSSRRRQSARRRSFHS
jgi:SNF2-related domain